MTVPAHRYTSDLASALEAKWQARWREAGAFRQPNPGDPGFDPSRGKYYCLCMFPYPSAAGLHVGHPLSYTATDVLSRFRRMRGDNVLFPMGWDAFGLPAEQYAIQTGVHPAETTRAAIDNYRRQLQRFGFSYDWSREFGTIDPDYYKWTQWIFLAIYDAWFDPRADGGRGRARPVAELVAELEDGTLGVDEDGAPAPGGRAWSDLDAAARRAVIDGQRLAYVGEQTVNWCPKLGTALANEEVIDGRSERGAYPVLRRPMKQWLFRITAYAERLAADLEHLDWPASSVTQQREWIGRSEGADVDFPLEGGRGALRVFTTRPDTIFGATFMVVAPEHPLVDEVLGDGDAPEGVRAYVEAARRRSDLERQESKEKTGAFLGVHATNPATGASIPVWVADYVLMGYGHGAIMAVPGQDDRDWAFAETFDLPIVRTVQPPADFEGGPYLGDGPAVNSGFLDGLHVEDAKVRTLEWLETEGCGRRRTTTRLRDWLFSRQRYWGEPFPIVWDPDGNHHAVGRETLPVELPPLADFTPPESDEPQPMLANAADWVETTAGAAGVAALPPDTPVVRETNTMPGWAGSCWYYLRYCDPKNDARFVDPDAEAYWMRTSGDNPGGVDLYIGGSEHVVLHLLYARFWHKVLFDLGHVSSPEPFAKMFHQGMITGFAYQRADKSLVAVDAVEERDGGFVESGTGEPVTRTIAKMSKSLKNVVNPDDVLDEYSADVFRLYEMYMGPLEDSKPWNTRDILGLMRFLQRAWRMAVDEETGDLRVRDEADPALEKRLHRTVAKVTGDLGRLAFNTPIAALIEFVNAAGDGVTEDQLDRFTRLLSPFAPHLAEELWSKLGRDGFAMHAPWPDHDEAMLVDDEVEIPVQILGKVRSRITVPRELAGEALEQRALEDPRIRELLAGKTIRKVIALPGKLVNVVAN